MSSGCEPDAIVTEIIRFPCVSQRFLSVSCLRELNSLDAHLT